MEVVLLHVANSFVFGTLAKDHLPKALQCTVCDEIEGVRLLVVINDVHL